MGFHAIDYENWDRKEIYDLFNGYLYCMTVEIDITEFLNRIHKDGYKFYPSICYGIAKTVNRDVDYRFAKVNGKIGYWDQLCVNYTLLRKNSNHLFTHKATPFYEDFDAFHRQFLKDKEEGENCNRLYCDGTCPPDAVHVSVMPGTTQKSLSYSKPASFTNYLTDNTSYIPFVTVGKYHQVHGRTVMPMTVEFHHAVNDGYHAEKFFALLEETLRKFA